MWLMYVLLFNFFSPSSNFVFFFPHNFQYSRTEASGQWIWTVPWKNQNYGHCFQRGRSLLASDQHLNTNPATSECIYPPTILTDYHQPPTSKTRLTKWISTNILLINEIDERWNSVLCFYVSILPSLFSIYIAMA